MAEPFVVKDVSLESSWARSRREYSYFQPLKTASPQCLSMFYQLPGSNAGQNGRRSFENDGREKQSFRQDRNTPYFLDQTLAVLPKG